MGFKNDFSTVRVDKASRVGKTPNSNEWDNILLEMLKQGKISELTWEELLSLNPKRRCPTCNGKGYVDD